MQLSYAPGTDTTLYPILEKAGVGGGSWLCKHIANLFLLNLSSRPVLFSSNFEEWKEDTMRVWFDLIYFDLVWFGLVWFGLVWFGLVWFDLIWFDLIWSDLIWFDLIWFDLIDELLKGYAHMKRRVDEQIKLMT